MKKTVKTVIEGETFYLQAKPDLTPSKSLGRGLFLVSLSVLLSGQEQEIGKSLGHVANFSSLHFSREQEE